MILQRLFICEQNDLKHAEQDCDGHPHGSALVLTERFGSGDGEREASMIRPMPYEPLPASVLFGIGSVIGANSKSFDGDRAFGGVHRGENPLDSDVRGRLAELPNQIHVAFRNV